MNKKEIKKNYKRANNFLHLDIFKLDYLLYTPSIGISYVVFFRLYTYISLVDSVFI